MDIQTLVDELDKWVNFNNENSKQIRKSGLTIHYSPTAGKWKVMYGLQRAGQKHTGFGDTIAEALQDKINKLNQDASSD